MKWKNFDGILIGTINTIPLFRIFWDGLMSRDSEEPRHKMTSDLPGINIPRNYESRELAQESAERYWKLWKDKMSLQDE